MNRVLFFFGLLLLTGAPAGADTAARWSQVKTEHFTVLSDAGEKQARHVAGQFERMQAAFSKLLPGAKSDKGSRIVVLALKDRKGFQTLVPSAYLQKNALNLAGFFMQRQDRSYVLLRLDTSGEHPYSTVYHEYTHYMTRHAKNFPLWLNEGLAEFYQNTELADKTVRFGEPSANEIMFLRQQRLLPLATLFAVDHNSPYYHESDKGNIFYAESWALTHYLSMEDYGKKPNRLHEYAVALDKGQGPLEAAQQAFGDLNQLQKQLEAYVNQGEFKLMTMPLQNTVDESTFALTPVSEPDADALRADVLVENGRTQEAEALLMKVLEVAPDNPQGHESMGLLKLRQGDLLAARKWYGEAVNLHSESYLSFYYFGSLSMREANAGDKAIGESLRHAVSLNPDFVPALAALSQFDAMRLQDLDEALQMSIRVVQLEPTVLNHRLNAAQVRVERKEYESAIFILRAAAELAKTPSETALVQERLNDLEQYQAQLKQVGRPIAHTGGAPTPLATSQRLAGSAFVTDTSGRRVEPIKVLAGEHIYPAGPPNGAKHNVHGTLHAVGCFYPKGLELRVDGSTQPLLLYSNDMYQVAYTAANFTPTKELNPCTDFEGLKANVTYAQVEGEKVAGQIVAIELSR